MINRTLKKFILQERYFSKSIEISIIKFLDCKDSYVKGGLAKDIIIKLIRKSPKNRVGGYEFVSELYHVEKHAIALTGKRDHITHVLNTFILGLYINKNFLNSSVDFNTWKNTALLHDIAYPLEIANKIGERYFDKLRSTKKNLGVGKYSPILKIVPEDFEKLTHNKNSFDYIQKRVDEWGIKVDVRKRFDDMLSNGELNHGIFGALTILFLVDLFIDKHNPKRKKEDIFHGEVNFSQNIFENRAISGCAAIYLHGLWPNDFYKELDKRKYPLPYLLKLSDELQNWERLSHDMSDGDPVSNYDIEVEKGILKFKVSTNKRKLRMEQNLKCLNDTEVKIVRLQRQTHKL